MKKIIIKNRDTEISILDGEEVFLVDNIISSVKGRFPEGKKLRVIIGKNCRVQYLALLKSGVSLSLAEKREIIIGAGSQLDSYQAYFGSGLSRLDFTNHLGQGVTVNSRVFFGQSGEEILEAEDKHIFTAPDSRGRFSVTGLLGGSASTKYYSDIVIKPAAQGTDSRIDMKLYLLEPGAKGIVLPSLKIAANEVKAGHGASTFQLSPEDLFYLAARGLPPEQARKLVIDSLASHFTEGLLDQAAQKLIKREIIKKYA